MNDEYLWQKTGEDPEIEKLEQKLGVLRYREAPLNFPVSVKAVETVSVPRWRISLAFAFAASIIAAMLFAAVFIGIGDKYDDEIVFVASPDVEIAPPLPAPTDEKKVTPAPGEKIVPQFAHSKRTPVVRTKAAPERRPKTQDPGQTTVALTEEEKYAYRQLMLALSISSSKLKIVKDSINGTENNERPNSTNQR